MKSLAPLMVLTFVTGFATGVYVFAAAREQGSVPLSVVVANNVSQGFSVTYDEYGACRTVGCLSYRVESGGGVHVSQTQNGRLISQQDYVLPDAVYITVVDTLKKTSFTKLPNAGACTNSRATYARVTATIGDAVYRYDTCTQTIPQPSARLFLDYTTWLPQ